ncbi:urea hydro-lyase/cyanamide hydratase, putative [Talaromyces stipitatus ATCC 10500]|uniref:Urea hydro-lyase/cyanamide hydratase, putative n=1 Tax=Talaromyces stipitatus (strain ATCC 10500 / CBS 375.48 / QM 6759 / NRRL 1006) TaxID=441959 RepID=B8LVL6_TALSN|nr:urea hydro-lyase/cyanamide hydratase, putative [Talaromyces stipitatus ATCC 10500]EED24146.1 urea hydro-lyase/cyanamide hydratase, putative [Talaromyces stipitatus ATCC 10500]
MSSNPITEYGFAAVPASATQLLDDPTTKPSSPPPAYSISDFSIPNTALAKRIQAYAKAHLPETTYNHSLRVYYFGQAIRQYRLQPSGGSVWDFSDETYFLSCLLHDIGTTEENLNKTRLSFEFYGGFLALDVLQHADDDDDATAIAPREQAESVAEAIIRHQDLCEIGKITAVGQLIQLATIFDNTGSFSDLVHQETIEAVSKAFPRSKWSTCFTDTIHKELHLKPWAHTAALGEEKFVGKVLGNRLMAPYE